MNLDKQLSEKEIKSILTRTAEDLGWTGFTISGQGGWYNLQVKSGSLARKSLNIIEASRLSLIIAEANKDNFLDKVYEQKLAEKESSSGYSPEYVGSDVEVVDISGFDACHSRSYLKAWRDLADCSEDDMTYIVIGNYLLQTLTHDMKKGKGAVCEKEDSLPIAKTFVNNFLEALK